MFQHILIPTDGSKLSTAALHAGMQLAKEQGAQVTVLYVMPDYSAMIYGAEALMTYNAAEFTKSAQKDADKVLQPALEMAQAKGVACRTARTTNVSIHQAIIKEAQDNHCDLICMASHGRKGIAGILLGSETQRVLVNSSVPVLVHRAA